MRAGNIHLDCSPTMSVQLSKSTFERRLKVLYDTWNGATQNDESGAGSIVDADALLLSAGDPAEEDEPIRKGTALQTWLLGYEFPSTLILFGKDKVSMLCSQTKAKILNQIKDSNAVVPVEIFAYPKEKDPPTDAIPNFVARYVSHKRVGTLLKEKHTGKLITKWQQAVDENSEKPELVDMAPAVSAFLAVKDTEELKTIQTAANLTSTLLEHHIAPKIETILDSQAVITHDRFAQQIEARLGSGEGDNAKGPDMKVWNKGKNLSDVDWMAAEFCYTPIIQSKSAKGGYDLKTSAESSEDNMAHDGVLLVSVGIRYKGLCSNLGRTFITDPTKEQEANYNFLVSLQTEVLNFMKDGVSARDVYLHAVSYIKEKKPELERHFVKNAGFGMGMEFRDSNNLISPKNTRIMKANMVFNLALGFSDIEDEKVGKYALQLNDTVRITEEKAIPLTVKFKSAKEVLFFLSAEEEAPKAKSGKKAPTKPLPANGNPSPTKNKTAGGKVLRNKTRSSAQEEVLQSTWARIAEHQRELHEALQQAGLAKHSEDGGGLTGKEGKGWKRFQSYKGEGALPKETEAQKIYIDKRSQTIILPVYGFAVPFHINTIKNVSKTDEGEHTLLRINFQTPGQLAGKKEDTPFEDPESTFVRSMTYRSTDSHRFDSISKQITELKKEVNKREQQRKEMADVVEQDNLVEMKGRRAIKLPEVFIRPPLDGKRLPGEVEIHQNGLRYQSPMGSQKVDILFSNIKHLFFQPCDHELIVLVHLHLKAPIMIGKKKAHDVQFFREASDVQFDETGNRKRKHRYGDEDEIEMEQMERKRRQALNKEFKLFAEKISEASITSTGDPLELDIPFRELSFEGVPSRTNVRLQPTTDCLVYLSDSPFTVVTLNEVEIVSLERVQFSLKQFDMVLIFKDFTKAPLHINSIPSSQLDDVKNWLNSVDIPFSEGPVNLNWAPIMKTINDSPYDFFQQGGWSFLGGAGGAPDSDHSDASESESDFEADSEDLVTEESSQESEYSDASSDESGSESEFDDEDSEGEDWDELEARAAKSDRKRAEANGGGSGSDDDDDDSRRKKKAPAKSNGKGKAPVKGRR